MIEYEAVNRAILKDGHQMFDEDVAMELNRKAALEQQRETFRKAILDLERYYMDESIKYKDKKPVVAVQEKRMSLLCAHILQGYDGAI